MNFSTNSTAEEPSINIRKVGIAVAVPLISFLTNAGFLAVGIQSLKKTFHNLLVLLLCFNEGVNGFSMAVFAISRTIEQFKDSTALCLVFFTAIFYGFLTSYAIIFLLGFVRLVTIRYQKYYFIYKLERYKYSICIITHVTSLLFVGVVNVSIHAAPPFKSCSAVTLYGKYYSIFILVGWVPISVLILTVIIMYLLTSYHIWKLFFKRNAVHPNPPSKNMELKAPRCQNSDEVVPEIALTDIGITVTLEASSECCDKKIEPCEQPRRSSSECYPDIKLDRNNENPDETIQSVTTETTIGKADQRRKVQKINTDNSEPWEVRAFKTNLIVASSTVFLTAPFAGTFLYDLFAQNDTSIQTREIVATFCVINNIVDPFIYAFRVPEIRENIKNKFCRR